MRHVSKPEKPRFDRKLLSIVPDHTEDILGKEVADQIVEVIVVLRECSDDGRVVEAWVCNEEDCNLDSRYALAARALASLPISERRKLLKRLVRNFILNERDSG